MADEFENDGGAEAAPGPGKTRDRLSPAALADLKRTVDEVPLAILARSPYPSLLGRRVDAKLDGMEVLTASEVVRWLNSPTQDMSSLVEVLRTRNTAYEIASFQEGAEITLVDDVNGEPVTVPAGLTVVVSQVENAGKSAFLAAIHDKTKRLILDFFEPQDPFRPEIRKHVPPIYSELWLEMSRQLSEPSADGMRLCVVDSLSGWLLLGSNLSAGGIARNATEEMKSFTYRLAALSCAVVTTVNAQLPDDAKFNQLATFLRASCSAVVTIEALRAGVATISVTSRTRRGRAPRKRDVRIYTPDTSSDDFGPVGHFRSINPLIER